MAKDSKKKEMDPLWLVFIAATIIVFFSMILYDDEKIEAQMVINELTNGGKNSIVSGEEVNQENLIKISGMAYNELKEEFHVDNEFCIYFEDEKGNIIDMEGVRSIGSSEIEINGVPCGN